MSKTEYVSCKFCGAMYKRWWVEDEYHRSWFKLYKGETFDHPDSDGCCSRECADRLWSQHKKEEQAKFEQKEEKEFLISRNNQMMHEIESLKEQIGQTNQQEKYKQIEHENETLKKQLKQKNSEIEHLKAELQRWNDAYTELQKKKQFDRELQQTRKCEICNKKFKPINSDAENMEFCSSECEARWQENLERTCKCCKKTFRSKDSDASDKIQFCSSACEIKLDELSRKKKERLLLGKKVQNLYDKVMEGKLSEIIIPDGVSKIKNSALWGCSNLTSVVIPDSVTEIGEMAFSSCSNLTSVVIPDSVTEIGKEAFRDCSSLKEVIFSNHRIVINESAFVGTALKYVVIPDQSGISVGAFDRKTKILKEGKLPESDNRSLLTKIFDFFGE